MRAFVLIMITMLSCGPAAYAGHGHALKKKIHEAHQAHAHKHKMKKAMHAACKEHQHHLLHHHKGGSGGGHH